MLSGALWPHRSPQLDTEIRQVTPDVGSQPERLVLRFNLGSGSRPAGRSCVMNFWCYQARSPRSGAGSTPRPPKRQPPRRPRRVLAAHPSTVVCRRQRTARRYCPSSGYRPASRHHMHHPAAISQEHREPQIIHPASAFSQSSPASVSAFADSSSAIVTPSLNLDWDPSSPLGDHR